MNRNELPTTDEEIENIILAGDERPERAGWSYVNWHNDFPCLVGFLVTAYEEGGKLGFREAAMEVARQICLEAFEREGIDREPKNEEILATVLRTLFCPDTNVGSRSNFILGAVSELHYRAFLENNGYTVLTDRAIERITGKTENEQECAGWDIVARNPNGELETFQVKATKSKPTWSKTKEYDNLIWFKHKNGELEKPQKIER